MHLRHYFQYCVPLRFADHFFRLRCRLLYWTKSAVRIEDLPLSNIIPSTVKASTDWQSKGGANCRLRVSLLTGEQFIGHSSYRAFAAFISLELAIEPRRAKSKRRRCNLGLKQGKNGLEELLRSKRPGRLHDARRTCNRIAVLLVYGKAPQRRGLALVAKARIADATRKNEHDATEPRSADGVCGVLRVS